jgi:hypothetical protein
MELEKLFEKLGAKVVRADTAGTKANPKIVMMLRVGVDEITQERWLAFITEALLHEEKDKRKAWTLDIGHVYFLRDGNVKYLWRASVIGVGKKGLDQGLSRIQQAVLSSLTVGRQEITEMPLVGRDSYAGMETKGAYIPGKQPKVG